MIWICLFLSSCFSINLELHDHTGCCWPQICSRRPELDSEFQHTLNMHPSFDYAEERVCSASSRYCKRPDQFIT